MKTFAVIKPISAAQYWDGNYYAKGKHGLIRSVGKINDQHYGLYIICGGALRDKAEAAAIEVRGTVVLVESEYWPDGSKVLEAYASSEDVITY